MEANWERDPDCSLYALISVRTVLRAKQMTSFGLSIYLKYCIYVQYIQLLAKINT